MDIGPHVASHVHIDLELAEATWLRHAISVALRSPVFDTEQRAALIAIENRLADLVDSAHRRAS